MIQKITVLNKDTKQLVREIERDLLFHIILNMRHLRISQKSAQNLAQEFLKIVKPENKVEFLKNLKNLSQKYLEAQEVYLKYAPVYYEERKQYMLRVIYDYVKTGNINKALILAKEENIYG